MNFKGFLVVFLVGYAVATTFLLGVSAWTQGYDGDLTRIAHLSERDFGWNQPIRMFRQHHTTYRLETNKHYTGKEDIVVFGDSFSHLPLLGNRRNYAWTTFLYEYTGLTSYVNHVEQKQSIDDWLERIDPSLWPEYIIYERAERRFQVFESNRIADQRCNIQMEPMEYHPAPLQPFPEDMDFYERDHGSLFEINAAIHWLKGLYKPSNKGIQVPLKRTDLFSHNKKDYMLLMGASFADHQFTEDKARNLACYFWNLKNIIESNGRSKFILAVVPERFHVYKDYLKTDHEVENMYEALAEQGYYIYRFDKLFREAIKTGELGPDVYLPNDTHWGPEGSRIFASGILSLIKQ